MQMFGDYLERKRREHGERFDQSDLSAQFVPFYESGKRIRVDFGHGDIKSGRVGVTTGWRPTFILLLTKRSRGSTWLLSDRCIIIGG
jgi:hypothetical protein